MNLHPPAPISFLGIGLMGKNQIKDLNAALEVATRLGVTLPLTQQVRQLFVDLAESGKGMLDHSALILRLEALRIPKN